MLAALFRTGKASRSAVANLNRHVFIFRKQQQPLSSLVEKDPILNAESLQQKLQELAPTMASSLISDGYWTNLTSTGTRTTLLSENEIRVMRDQSISLREEGRFEQSWSESINEQTGQATRFDKEGVYACEPDGNDYFTAPDLLVYMSTMIGLLPPLLNDAVNHQSQQITTNNNNTTNDTSSTTPLALSNQAFNAKLAVTSPGGSVYPLHVDNTFGVKGSLNDDTRKLTCIIYLNPDYVKEESGGELRLLLNDNQIIDLDPCGGRIVLFWSDEIPHEVLPCAPSHRKDDGTHDRYALTVWIPDLDVRNIQRAGSRFESLRKKAFPPQT